MQSGDLAAVCLDDEDHECAAVATVEIEATVDNELAQHPIVSLAGECAPEMNLELLFRRMLTRHELHNRWGRLLERAAEAANEHPSERAEYLLRTLIEIHRSSLDEYSTAVAAFNRAFFPPPVLKELVESQDGDLRQLDLAVELMLVLVNETQTSGRRRRSSRPLPILPPLHPADWKRAEELKNGGDRFKDVGTCLREFGVEVRAQGIASRHQGLELTPYEIACIWALLAGSRSLATEPVKEFFVSRPKGRRFKVKLSSPMVLFGRLPWPILRTELSKRYREWFLGLIDLNLPSSLPKTKSRPGQVRPGPDASWVPSLIDRVDADEATGDGRRTLRETAVACEWAESLEELVAADHDEAHLVAHSEIGTRPADDSPDQRLTEIALLDELSPLTDTQWAVLKLVVAGYSLAEAAARLGLSPSYPQRWCAAMRRKLSVLDKFPDRCMNQAA
jgi:hypothetical protein